MQLLVILRYRVRHKQAHGLYQVSFQLRVLPTYHQYLYARILYSSVYRHDAHNVALAATSCAAIAHIPLCRAHKLLLLFIQLSQLYAGTVSLSGSRHYLLAWHSAPPCFYICTPTTLCSLYYFRRKPLLAPTVGLAPTLSGLEPPVLLLH